MKKAEIRQHTKSVLFGFDTGSVHYQQVNGKWDVSVYVGQMVLQRNDLPAKVRVTEVAAHKILRWALKKKQIELILETDNKNV